MTTNAKQDKNGKNDDKNDGKNNENDKKDRKDKNEERGGKGGGAETERAGGSSEGNRPNPIDLQRHLKGVDYPATRDELVSKAREAGANEDILRALEGIPERDYEDPAQVSEAVGKDR